jgi:hypothetical protein
MPSDDRTDDYGRLILDSNDPTTIAAWAILQFHEIDPSLIFLREDDARSYVALQAGDKEHIVPVLVTGTTIQRV